MGDGSEPGDDPAAPPPSGATGGSNGEGNGGGLSLDPNPNPDGQPDVPPSGGNGGATDVPVESLENVLVFTRTAGFRHDSIGTGVEAIRQLGNTNGFAVVQTEEASTFSDAGLAAYDVVVWLSTTGDVLDTVQQAAFERYIRAGGGWVGVHAAADTEYDWPWYGQLLGGAAYFLIHPVIQTAELNVEQAEHASTSHLPQTFSLQDEWYNFRANPRESVSVLLTLNEMSYTVGEGSMGDHPIAWYHTFEGGRAFYTGLGHRTELYQDAMFTQHLLGGIRWAAGVAP